MNAAWQHLRRRWPEYLIEAAGLGVLMRVWPSWPKHSSPPGSC